MGAEILIQHGSTIQYPAVVEGAKLTLERKGTPGKLTFTVVKDSKLNFQEGDPVKLTLDGTPMFYGFVFIKSRDKDGTIDVTAYDQLRYLKNKDTITEEGLKASDLLKRIATDFRLNLGTVEDTGYTMETVVEENQTLFDMIQNALDETLLNTGKLYVLYDDVGSLTLKDINSMKTNLLIDMEAAENFSYSSSIDDATYNKIKLAFNNEKTGKRELYVAQDGEKINQWGVLQYFEEIQTATGAAAKAEAMLAHYDRKTRKLTIKNAFARPDIRAGSAVMVSLNLGDIIANQYLMAEKVVFTFKEDENMMDLTLVGGEFVA
ncbi:hydrolase [Colidextribacter sp. OB.20]|uniref:XkdQ/YqbQ family protein n=1 Tax=Colidextribacter sp. OB.20 TaxID=2304568 RepID=UPI00136ECA4A|nr:hydrolase [Colidextribacter sp. OB.20]NBI09232.1 hydrolase [Colidextribacter sp. OB.20]